MINMPNLLAEVNPQGFNDLKFSLQTQWASHQFCRSASESKKNSHIHFVRLLPYRRSNFFPDWNACLNNQGSFTYHFISVKHSHLDNRGSFTDHSNTLNHTRLNDRGSFTDHSNALNYTRFNDRASFTDHFSSLKYTEPNYCTKRNSSPDDWGSFPGPL